MGRTFATGARSILVSVLAFSACAVGGPRAVAQQLDIEALRAQLKALPGGDAAVRMIDANRARIDAANADMAANVAAQKSKAKGEGRPAPVYERSPIEVLAMISQPPKNVSVARKRLGKTAGGPGDATSVAATAELKKWRESMGAQVLSSPSAASGTISGEQGEVMKELTSAFRAALKDTRAAELKLYADLAPAKVDLLSQEGAISRDTSLAQSVREGRVLTAREAYLARQDVVVRAFRADTAQAIAQWQDLLDKAKASFGAVPPQYVYTQIYGLEQEEQERLAQLIALNDDLTATGAAPL